MNTSAALGWPPLLAVAAPFVLALAFIGKYLINKLDASEKEKKELYEKVIGDILAALNKSTTVINANSSVLEQVVDYLRETETREREEHDLRVRLEERLNRPDRKPPDG